MDGRTDATTCLVVMGVSGSGKTTVARAVAGSLGWRFAEGDLLHPPENVAKMRRGIALTDVDRWPWLNRIEDWIDLQEGQGASAVVTCSALRRSYRDQLATGRSWLRFCLVDVAEEVLVRRLAGRKDHFMPPSLLASQLATLEPVQPDEPAFVVDGELPVRQVVDQVLRGLHAQD